MSPADLAHVMRELGDLNWSDRLLVGPEHFADAGIVRLDDETALVQTVDFFPPVVDDPYMYGAIAAANSLSDCFAMGGRPLSALALAAFPEGFDPAITAQIMKGGVDKLREAGAVLAGGHTVANDEISYGYAVTGTVHPERYVPNDGAVVGDVLFLTKPIGMGSVTTALKKRKAPVEYAERACRQMAHLNAAASGAMLEVGVHACTDVTGFGLLGHASHVARASSVSFRLEASAIPVFEGAEALVRGGLLSGGAERTRVYLGEQMRVAPSVPRWLVNACLDAETSGGLLIAVSPDRADALSTALVERGELAARIGGVVSKDGAQIELV